MRIPFSTEPPPMHHLVYLVATYKLTKFRSIDLVQSSTREMSSIFQLDTYGLGSIGLAAGGNSCDTNANELGNVVTHVRRRL